MSEINKLIEVATKEVGYLEKKSNKNLDSKTLNAGKNNYTKYARDLDSIKNFYNGKKQGFAWCDVFVDWCFVQSFGVDRARELLLQPNKSLGAGCKYSMNYYKKAKQLYDSPKKGDQIFFKSTSGSITHTGLVYKVDSTYVYTIEGNTSSGDDVVYANGGCVRKKKYKLTNKNIAGYGRPKYKEEKEIEIKYVYNCDTLNVRMGAGTKYGIVRTIKEGTKVNVYKISGSWARIGTNEWCSNKYLSKTKPASYPTKIVYNCNTLNVRNKPSILGKKIGFLNKNDKVKVYETKGSWSKIAKDSNKWCSSKYLK